MQRILPALPLLLLLARPAAALIYLPENTLESMLVRSDAVAIGTATEVSESTDHGSISVDETLKGNAPASIAVTGVMLRVDTNLRKPRFAKGDRIVVFLGPLNSDTGARPILHTQKLDSDAEVRTMHGCILEILPMAQLLADLGDIHKEIKPDPLRAALTTLVISKNSYTQILLGRLMDTRLAPGVKPEGWEPILALALASPRKELAKGAMSWTAKFEHLPEALRTILQKQAADSPDADIKKAAQNLLQKFP